MSIPFSNDFSWPNTAVPGALGTSANEKAAVQGVIAIGSSVPMADLGVAWLAVY